MRYCRFCGEELVDGQCDCYEYQASVGNVRSQYQQAYQKSKEPLIIPKFRLKFSSVGSFISSVRDQSGMSEPELITTDPFEHNVPIVPDCLQPEENEIVVKQYNIAKLRTRLKFMKAEGRLMVTNRRILFRAAGTSLTGNILQEHQFNLDELGGIEIHKDYKFSFLSFFGCMFLDIFVLALVFALFASSTSTSIVAVGIILGIIGLLPTFLFYKRFWIKLMCAIASSGFFSMAVAISDGNGFLRFLLIMANIIVFIDLIIVVCVPNLVIKIKTEG